MVVSTERLSVDFFTMTVLIYPARLISLTHKINIITSIQTWLMHFEFCYVLQEYVHNQRYVVGSCNRIEV